MKQIHALPVGIAFLALLRPSIAWVDNTFWDCENNLIASKHFNDSCARVSSGSIIRCFSQQVKADKIMELVPHDGDMEDLNGWGGPINGPAVPNEGNPDWAAASQMDLGSTMKGLYAFDVTRKPLSIVRLDKCNQNFELEDTIGTNEFYQIRKVPDSFWLKQVVSVVGVVPVADPDHSRCALFKQGMLKQVYECCTDNDKVFCNDDKRTKLSIRDTSLPAASSSSSSKGEDE